MLHRAALPKSVGTLKVCHLQSPNTVKGLEKRSGGAHEISPFDEHKSYLTLIPEVQV
jgi:hypothetical protein